MAGASKISPETMKFARKGGLKGSKPKKPKSKTATALANYVASHGAWVKKVNEFAKKGRSLEALRAKVRGM